VNERSKRGAAGTAAQARGRLKPQNGSRTATKRARCSNHAHAEASAMQNALNQRVDPLSAKRYNAEGAHGERALERDTTPRQPNHNAERNGMRKNR